MDYSENYRPTDDDVLLYDPSDFGKKCENNDAVLKLMTILQNRPKSIVIELNTFRKYVPKLIKALIDANIMMNASIKQNKRFTDIKSEKSHKRWTDNEDKMLIDMVCDENCSIMEIATTFGRTTSSIQARLTYLVGVKRISQKIAGKFIGTADGEDIEASIEGIVYKE